MRGKEYGNIIEISGSRITPAYAGKSLQPETAIQIRRDHPRLCGEKRLRRGFGSSSVGITPAYAGKRNGTRRNTC